MTNIEIIMGIISENNGTITSSQISEVGLSRGNLKYLVDKGMIERSARGVYILPEVWDDDFFNLQVRYKKGIFSGETALFLIDMTDRTPNKLQMTFPLGYNTESIKSKNVGYSRVKKDLHELGSIMVNTPSGNQVKCYGIERTLCDILKGRSHTDIQIVSEAFKRYSKSKYKNIPLLSEYAKKLRVEKKLRSYLEVLL